MQEVTTITVYFKNEYIKVTHDPANNVYALIFLKKIPSDEKFVEYNSKLIEAFLTGDSNKFIVDARLMGVMSASSKGWVIGHMVPSIVKHAKNKLVYHAQVLSNEVFSKFAAQQIKKATTEKAMMETKPFDNYEEAITWLEQQNNE